jgi:uncharacterized membrane protein
MQAINVFAITPVFMTALFGTGLACLVGAVYAAAAGMGAATVPVIAGGATYFVGNIVVTIVCNVPLNNAIAAFNPTAADAGSLWTRYRRQWLAWNHVRTLTGIVSGGLFAYALTLP